MRQKQVFCIIAAMAVAFGSFVNAGAAENDNAKETSVVYMTADISPEGLMSVYQSLGWTPKGEVAVKLSTGEPPASNYLDPELI